MSRVMVSVACAMLWSSVSSMAASGGASDDEWEVYYPGRYDAADAKVIGEFRNRLDGISAVAGQVNIHDVISGKLTNASTPSVSWNPMENGFTVTRERMLSHAYAYTNDNPLFLDDSYARQGPYGQVIAFPLVFTNECMPAMPRQNGLGDYFVVSSHNDVTTYHRPVVAGDKLYTVYTEQHVHDITPPSGSRYRTFALSASCKTYNQRGELVAEGANILKESLRRRVDPAKRNADRAHAWESPDWWQRKPHVYTDADWAIITAAWKSAKRRGAQPLFWDDVQIGDRIGPSYSAPILSDQATDMMFEVPRFAIDIKKNMLDPQARARLVKNQQGIYVLPENRTRKAVQKDFSGAGRDTAGRDTDILDTRVTRTPELANRDGRATVQNAVIAKFVAGMIYDWMGDRGWLQRIGWDILWTIPGYDTTVIPSIPTQLYPALFDKFPVFDPVPELKAKASAPYWHALEGDLIVSNAYVTGKYAKDGEHFVDLTWWSETFDKHLVERGFVTVKLPKK